MPAATATARLDDAVKLSAFIIREWMMRYFKGSCVASIAPGDENICMSSVRELIGSHQYDRQRAQIQNKQQLIMCDRACDMYFPLMTVEREPSLVTIHLGNFDRSKVMRSLRAEVEDFLHRHLRAVDVTSNADGEPQQWKHDKHMILKVLEDYEKYVNRERRNGRNPQDAYIDMSSLAFNPARGFTTTFSTSGVFTDAGLTEAMEAMRNQVVPSSEWVTQYVAVDQYSDDEVAPLPF